MAFNDRTQSRKRKYDVFLNFRGADTRKGFTDHLYTALDRVGICTFRDDNEIDYGREIAPECRNAIEESEFSIVVLSKGYASSTYCLDELVHIQRCRKKKRHEVLPVFYDIDPSDVESQTGSFAEAFEEHRKHYNKDTVDEWRTAVQEVHCLKGIDLQKQEDGHEARNIDNIVKEILHKLDRKKLSVAIHPVGLVSRANEVISLLRLNDKSVDVCMVGIYGIGGIGKTCIAKEVYNTIFEQFDGSCFLGNVRERSKSKGITKLQRELLSEILERKYEKINHEDNGLKSIEERLCHKRVLLVLDDVDEPNQLNKILGSCSWLFPGSRVIITTRAQDLLNSSTFYQQYKVKALYYEDALKLLSLHAFEQSKPPESYTKCASEVVRYTRGVPLALEVLGSSLHKQSIDEWKRRLKSVEACVDKEINRALEISFYSLAEDEKLLFLDIACFFIGKDKDFVISICESRDFLPTCILNTLIKKCLITIGFFNELCMHDLIRDMARGIVREESCREPGERTRIWHHKDAIDVLKYHTGTEKVEGLALDQPGLHDSFNAKAFKKMKSLRLLQLNYASLDGNCDHISRKLRWLCWREFPWESIPPGLHLENLVALDLRYSSLKQFSDEEKFLEKLKYLNLSHSLQLTGAPNFECVCNLETFILKGCKSLKNLPDSIGLLKSLQMLDMSGCSGLQELPDSAGRLTCLVSLNLQECESLTHLPRSIRNLRSLENLNVSGCSKLECFGEIIQNLVNLKTLSLQRCPVMGSPTSCPKIINVLPASLKELDIRYCNLSDDVLPNDLQSLVLLQDLKLCGNNFVNLPPSVVTVPNLQNLWLNKCRKLKFMPPLQSSLKGLIVNGCRSLRMIDLTNYEGNYVQIRGCKNLNEIKGFFNMEIVEAETVKKLLRTNRLFNKDSIAKMEVHMINLLTQTHKISPIQALCEGGIYSLFLPGGKIPKWFGHEYEGCMISLEVPSLEQDSRIVGLVICAIYAWEKSDLPCQFYPVIEVINRTKNFVWLYKTNVAFLPREVEQDVMWLSYWMSENNLQKDCMDKSDVGLIFSEVTEEGDQIDVSIRFGDGIIVKKCGVHMLYHNDAFSNDLAIISHATSTHVCGFWEPAFQGLTIRSQKEIITPEWNTQNPRFSLTLKTLQGYLLQDQEPEEEKRQRLHSYLLNCSGVPEYEESDESEDERKKEDTLFSMYV